MSLIKGVLMLFIGGMCIASGVFLVMVVAWGGTREAVVPPPPPAPSPPAPVDPPAQPGHPALWKLLHYYDTAEGKIAAFLEKRQHEKDEKMKQWKSIEDGQGLGKQTVDPNKKLFELPPELSPSEQKKLEKKKKKEEEEEANEW